MARKTAPTTAHPDEHPAMTLFDALNGLHTVCSNARLFRELAERRERARDRHLENLNTVAKIASDRANARLRAGASTSEAFGEIAWVAELDTDPPPPGANEPPEYTKSLRENVLDHGRTLCERAREALRAGGAKGLDAATHPNAAGQARSIELHTKLQDAERVFVGLTIGVGDPRIIIDKDAASMADLGEWFARTRDELGAVFETRGLDAPAPTPTESVPPELVAQLKAAVAGLPAVLEGNRAGFERVAGVIESLGARDDDDKPAAMLPELQPHDRQAWLLWKAAGNDQAEVAKLLNKEHGLVLEQGQVSRMCGRFQKYIDAGGIAGDLPKPAARARVVDPARTELGARTDKRKPRPSDMARANDDDE